MKNIILKYGVIFGLIASVFGYLFMNGTIGMGVNSVVSFVGILITLFLAGREYRGTQDGFASFGELLKLFLGVIMVVVVISVLASVVNISTMSEAAKTEITDNFMASQISMYESLGVNDTIMDKMEEDLEEQAEKMFDISNIMLGSVMSIFIYFLLSLIPAGVLKKN